MNKFVDYGIDAPKVIRNLSLGGIVLSITYYFIFMQLYAWYSYTIFYFLAYFTSVSCLIFMLATAFYMIWSSKIGKLRQADKLLRQITWSGDEKVLDVGCGRGLLLLKAAKYLTKGGKAIGIDIWSQDDLSNNSTKMTLENAKIEGVIDRIEVQNGDVRKLIFKDNSFDVVVSSLVIHNINRQKEREKALDEMIRVLKPGGKMLMQDIFHTKQYFNYLQKKIIFDVQISKLQWLIFPPVRMLIIKK